MAAFLARLKAVNETIADPDKKAGFYGLDVYSLGASIEAVLVYLDRVDPDAARIARQRYGCLAPWRAEPARYGHMALSSGYALCEKPVTEALVDLLRHRLGYLAQDGDAFFDAEQNARIVTAAEQYYRVMYYGAAQSWNLRDQHMFDTLERVLAHRGPDSKAVVWAHNSHIGDAAFTEMGQVRGEFNIGQLARARFGDDAALIGFGTDRGTVAAASNWDEPMEIKRVRPARDEFLRRPLTGRRHRRLLPRDRLRPEGKRARRTGRAAAGAGDRRHLPPGNGTAVALFPGGAVAAVRCMDLVHGDASRGGAAASPSAWARRDLPVRTIRSEFRLYG